MQLKKVQKMTETVEENVLEISEKEFHNIVKELLGEELKENLGLTEGNKEMAIGLSMVTSLFAGRLHKRLFGKETKNE